MALPFRTTRLFHSSCQSILQSSKSSWIGCTINKCQALTHPSYVTECRLGFFDSSLLNNHCAQSRKFNVRAPDAWQRYWTFSLRYSSSIAVINCSLCMPRSICTIHQHSDPAISSLCVSFIKTIFFSSAHASAFAQTDTHTLSQSFDRETKVPLVIWRFENVPREVDLSFCPKTSIFTSWLSVIYSQHAPHIGCEVVI